MTAPIVVFGTKDIYRDKPSYEGQEPIFEHHCRHGRYEAFWSTGKLETALERGCEIYVVSIRWVFYDPDLWWAEMVPDDHVFHNGLAVIGNYPAADLKSRLMASWHAFFDHLGVPWDETIRDWDDPIMRLVAEYGIIDGSIIPGFTADHHA